MAATPASPARTPKAQEDSISSPAPGPPTPNSQTGAWVDLRIWGTGDTGYWFPSPRLQHPAPRQRGGVSLSPGLAAGPAPSFNSGTPTLSSARLLCSSDLRASGR